VRVLLLVAPLLLAAGLLVLPPNGAATTAPSLIVGVKVTLTPQAVRLSAKRAPRGNFVQFNVHNATGKRRTFSLAGRTIAVPARRGRLLVIFFDARGRYPYVSRTSQTAIRGIFRID
jgi:hypothetical protein